MSAHLSQSEAPRFDACFMRMSYPHFSTGYTGMVAILPGVSSAGVAASLPA